MYEEDTQLVTPHLPPWKRAETQPEVPEASFVTNFRVVFGFHSKWQEGKFTLQDASPPTYVPCQ